MSPGAGELDDGGAEGERRGQDLVRAGLGPVDRDAVTGDLPFDRLDGDHPGQRRQGVGEAVEVLAELEAVGRVLLHGGEELQLERTGDLGNGNAGMLIFADGDERPEYVPWADIERIDLDDPGRVFSAPGNLMKRTPA